MSSEEIKTIYRKLLQSYVDAYPHRNSIWLLNTRIEAYVKHKWEAKEPAILDLALSEGIEIPKVKELIEKGKTRKEAILEVSKNMKFRMSETEAKKWLKELEKEKPGKAEKVAKQKMEQQVEDYEKTVEEKIVKFKRGLSELSAPPPTPPTPPARGLSLKVISKYFAHGLLFSILFIVMFLVWAFILALLVVSGAIIGLIIGFCLLLLIIGFLNSVITDFLWFTVNKAFWGTFFHGLILFIILLITQGIFVWVPNLIFRSIYVQIITFIVGTFLNGLVGKKVAGFWKEIPD